MRTTSFETIDIAGLDSVTGGCKQKQPKQQPPPQQMAMAPPPPEDGGVSVEVATGAQAGQMIAGATQGQAMGGVQRPRLV
ncbi:MAG TPA: hypothetical protein VIV11_42825 [Kofleriaceae bacterium]